jgi:glucosamine-phosphate N-acetyltransferase
MSRHNLQIEGKFKFSTDIDVSATLFDSSIFLTVNTNNLKFKYDRFELKQIGPHEWGYDLGDSLILRALKTSDFDKGFLKLLEQLTVVGDDVTREKFENRFRSMKTCENSYYVVVVEDLNLNKIVGSITLVNEQKFIRHASSRGRIEDVVVDDSYRGKRLGKLITDFMVLLSKHLGCYKLSLECEDKLRKFYGQFGLVLENNQNFMCIRFQNQPLVKSNM